MPLKLIPPRQGRTPNYSIRGTYLGQRIDRTTGTADKATARKVLRKIEDEIERGAFVPKGAPTFASAALNYLKAGGEDTFLRPLMEHFGTTPLARIDQAAIDQAAHMLYPRGTPATRNRQVYTPISAILKHAGASIALRRPRGSDGNRPAGWLWPEQAERMFEEARKLDTEFAALLVLLCYTGLRLSEALRLTWADVRLQDEFAFVADTKNGEPRPVFLPPVTIAALAGLSQQRSSVFPWGKSGHIYSLLTVTAIRAGVDLPPRQAFHIFRHTYGTWMRRYAGADSVALVATGAWKDRKSVERYTHTVVSEEARRALLLPVGRRKAEEG